MRGHEVRNLQIGLSDNDYGVFLRGGPDSIDGEFGPLTAQAVYRAKYWLGYAKGDLNHTAGEKLRRILAGKDKLAPTYRVRRANRLRKKAAAAKRRPMRLKALDAALSKVGMSESPAGSNSVEFNRWYYSRDVRAPWCAAFVTWAYVHGGGSKALKRGTHYVYTPYMTADALAGRNNLTVTHDPRPGDIVMYDWDGGVTDHTGLFMHWNGPGKVSFTAVEGNTSAGNNSNGGQVQRRPDRLIGNVVCFIRVGE